MSVDDIKDYLLNLAPPSGARFYYEDLASHAVNLGESELARKLLAICQENPEDKIEDLEEKIKRTTIQDERDLHMNRQACAVIGLLNGCLCSFWMRAKSTRKWVKMGEGIVGFDGGDHILIKNPKTGMETSHHANERDLVEDKIKFEEIDGSEEKENSCKSRSPTTAPATTGKKWKREKWKREKWKREKWKREKRKGEKAKGGMRIGKRACERGEGFLFLS
jgi:hypothetical protein